MKSTILFTTEAQRAQSNDPSAPPTALASPACGWSRVSEGNPSVVGLSMLQSFRLFFGCSVSVLRSLGLAGCFVVSLLVLIPALHAQTNTFPSSGNVGIKTRRLPTNHPPTPSLPRHSPRFDPPPTPP